MILQRLFGCLLISAGLVFPQPAELTLEDIFLSRRFAYEGYCNLVWIPDEPAFLHLKQDSASGSTSIYRFEVPSGSETVYLSRDGLVVGTETLDIASFWINSTRTWLLIATDVRRIWRHSREGTYYLVDLQTFDIQPLGRHNTNLRNVKFSPAGSEVAYVRDNDLYVYDIRRRNERRLTRDGSNDIINGQFGWVYEEEFGSADGYRWSPDSKFIAFWRLDQSRVKRFTLIDELTLYPSLTSLPYPKAGETNPGVKIGIVTVATRRCRWVDLGNLEDSYIPRITWAGSSGRLAVMRLNRRQNHLELLFAESRTGKTRLILTESDPAWIDIRDDWRFLRDGSFIWSSERSGYRHAYHFSEDGELLNPVTRGTWEMTRVLELDEARGILYFMSNRESVLESHLYSVQLNGQSLTRITGERGFHGITFSSDKQYFLDTWSNAATPPATVLRARDGSLLATLIASGQEIFQPYDLTAPRFITVPAGPDGPGLNAMLTLPRDFEAHKKYPVIVYGYAGPGSQVVLDRWGGRRYLWHQYMSRQGFICFSIDNRGTGGRGKEFKNLAYGDLGRWSVQDHIAGVQYLRSLEYVDPQRIGIWGWSGGGYLAALCLTKAADFFQVGVAVAPVSDFRLYDTIWTERYLGLPQENQAGYDSSSVFTYVARFKGRLLLIHGTGDDNVHPQNTQQLAQRFVESQKMVDMYLYPGGNHGLGGPNITYNVYWRMAEYFIRNL